MKANFKSTLLMAVLATAGFGAQAEGFGFYALLDGGVATTSITGGTPASSTATKFITGGYAPNFLGITNEKSLGKDLVGGFKLEQGLLLNSDGTTFNQLGYGANQSIFNRQANVYVQSKYGKVTVGTQANIAFSTVLVNDPRIGSNYGSSLGAIDIDGALNTVDVGAITYAAPTFYGLDVKVSHVPEAIVSGTRQSGNRLSAVYNYKDLTATYAHYYDVSGGASIHKGNIVGATYKFGPLSAKAIAASQYTTTYSSLDTTGLGGTYVINPETTLDFGVYNTKDSGTNYKADTIGVGVSYKFLKDLTAYAQYAVVKNNGTTSATYNFTWTEAIPGISAGQTASTLNVGLLYGFF